MTIATRIHPVMSILIGQAEKGFEKVRIPLLLGRLLRFG